MACYDPRNDKIYGCKEGSLVWWHEKGHQKLFRSGLTSEKDTIITFCILLGWAFLVVELPTISKWFLIVVLFIIGLEEIGCWFYAFYKYRRNKK